MRRGRLFGIGLAAVLLAMLPGGVTHATPSMPYILVNESTRQCYVSIMNDECFWCDPPPGWKVFGTGNPSYGTTDCPAGYQKIDQLELVCQRYKTPMCCGGFSSHGDCTDMVVNATLQACAFVDNANACVLPEGWSKRPTDVPEGIWSCNYSTHKWVENVTCLTMTPTPERISIENFANQQPAALPVGGIALIALGAGMIAWIRRRR